MLCVKRGTLVTATVTVSLVQVVKMLSSVWVRAPECGRRHVGKPTCIYLCHAAAKMSVCRLASAKGLQTVIAVIVSLVRIRGSRFSHKVYWPDESDNCNISVRRAPRPGDQRPGHLRGNLASRFRVAACTLACEEVRESISASFLHHASIGPPYQTRTPRAHTSRAYHLPCTNVGYLELIPG